MNLQIDEIADDGFVNLEPIPKASASLVLGILSIIGALIYGVPGLIFSILAIVFGRKGKKLYAHNKQKYTKESFEKARAGYICGIIGLILSILMILLVVVVVIYVKDYYESQAYNNYNLN